MTLLSLATKKQCCQGGGGVSHTLIQIHPRNQTPLPPITVLFINIVPFLSSYNNSCVNTLATQTGQRARVKQAIQAITREQRFLLLTHPLPLPCREIAQGTVDKREGGKEGERRANRENPTGALSPLVPRRLPHSVRVSGSPAKKARRVKNAPPTDAKNIASPSYLPVGTRPVRDR